jgi:hypothetical protein
MKNEPMYYFDSNAYLQYRKAPVEVALFYKIGLYLGVAIGSVGLLYLCMSLEITAIVNLDIGVIGAIGMALGLIMGVWLFMLLSALIGQIIGSLLGKCLNLKSNKCEARN